MIFTPNNYTFNSYIIVYLKVRKILQLCNEILFCKKKDNNHMQQKLQYHSHATIVYRYVRFNNFTPHSTLEASFGMRYTIRIHIPHSYSYSMN